MPREGRGEGGAPSKPPPVTCGLQCAAAARGLESMLFNVTSIDAMTYGGMIGLVAVVALAASSVPAWRTASIDPTIALRSE